ncbi:MAG: hypothetical protein OXG72_20215, partial [Acidobacteria bacterium]|nr:hypothetical protein [Acidobacteriota bacterium]
MRSRSRMLGRLPLVLAGVVLAGTAAGQPAAHLVDAARDGDAAAVRSLLDAGVPPGTAQPDGTTALHWAAHRDDLQ